MSRKKRATRTRKTGRRITVPLVIAALILGGLGVLLGSQPFRSGADVKLQNSDSAFSVPTHVGQPAPAFTATGVDGKPYTVTPGDGRPKALVFYMGYQ